MLVMSAVEDPDSGSNEQQPESQQPIFRDLTAEEENPEATEIESMCMACEKNVSGRLCMCICVFIACGEVHCWCLLVDVWFWNCLKQLCGVIPRGSGRIYRRYYTLRNNIYGYRWFTSGRGTLRNFTSGGQGARRSPAVPFATRLAFNAVTHLNSSCRNAETQKSYKQKPPTENLYHCKQGRGMRGN